MPKTKRKLGRQVRYGRLDVAQRRQDIVRISYPQFFIGKIAGRFDVIVYLSNEAFAPMENITRIIPKNITKPLFGLLAALALAGCVDAFVKAPITGAGRTFDAGKVSFSVKVNEVVTSYDVFGVYVTPGATVSLVIEPSSGDGNYAVAADSGTLTPLRSHAWQWHAPDEPGLYEVLVRAKGTSERMQLNLFVMVPRDRTTNGQLNNYRIGQYPTEPLRDLPIYLPPVGFVEVTPDLLTAQVSPHFQLGQFLCKQESDFPKYLVLRESLVQKLEVILAEVNRQGFHTSSLVIMSGYRTPSYNEGLGNGLYSRHLWGGAADIFIDVAPRDDVMDDLNNDGKIDTQDADMLNTLIDSLIAQSPSPSVQGGLSSYKATDYHGPYVHVDARGWDARW